MTKEDMLKEMETTLETRGEEGLEAYILEHFDQLPKEVQGKALMSFFQAAVEKEAGEAAIAEMQKEGMQAMDVLEKFREAVAQGGAAQA